MAYKFTSDIEKLLQVFDDYLRSKHYAVDTIRQTRNYAGIYLKWLEAQKVMPEQVNYKRFMDFIFHLKKTKTLNHTRHIILAVRHYYNSLGSDKNPAAGIHIRGHRASILNNIIPYKTLIELYQNYPVLDDRTKRNKVILGLFIYQGITSGALQKLEPEHLKLNQGRIYIPAHAKSNSRTLELQATQLLDLQQYLLIIRPRMLANVGAYRSGRKPDQIDPVIHERLFFSQNGSSCLKNSLLNLFRAIRKTHPKIISGKTIRSTVIAEWLKTIDIRIVQYMAGHRYVSSTERYNVFNLQELKDALKKYHPLK